MASQGLAIVVRGSTDVHISAVRITATNATYTYTNGILEIAGENGTTVIARNVSFVSSANGTCIINNTVCMHGMTVELRARGRRRPGPARRAGRPARAATRRRLYGSPRPARDQPVRRRRRGRPLCRRHVRRRLAGGRRPRAGRRAPGPEPPRAHPRDGHGLGRD